MSTRNEIADVSATIRDTERDLARLTSRRSPLADWKDPSDRSFYATELAKSNRLAVIGRLAPDSKCPICKSPTLARDFMVRKDNQEVRCRSCFRALAGVGATEVIGGMLFSEFNRYELNWRKLDSLIVSRGVSVQKFADICGYSRSYMRKLLNGEYESVDSEKKDVIVGALVRIGVEGSDF